MARLLAALLLLPLAALSAVLPPDDATEMTAAQLEPRVVSPNKTCGLVLAGNRLGYTCPSDAACCSQYGYCGSTDAFCLTSAGCQTRYSNSSGACYAPRPGVTVSIDGTCGSTAAGKDGYRCPANATATSCCSVAWVSSLWSDGSGERETNCYSLVDIAGIRPTTATSTTGARLGLGTAQGRRPRASRVVFVSFKQGSDGDKGPKVVLSDGNCGCLAVGARRR